jgi:F-type H+-transporting ATPase subunit delta
MNTRSVESIADGFISYVRQQGLEERLPEVIECLQREADRQVDITVVSAASLDEGERREIGERVQQKWGEHHVRFHVDPLLVSGLIVHFRDQLIDLSGHGRLSDLQAHLS